jgi:hypothetical protein
MITESLAGRYTRLQAEMRALRGGNQLAAAADAVEHVLPSRPVALIATSDEGTALAAICAARRGDSTSWMKVDLMQPEPVNGAVEVVVVEPVDAGAAWRQALDRAYPGARVLIVSELVRVVRVAA